MCNRYSQTKRERDLVTRLGTLELSLEPRYNIAPTNIVTVALVEENALKAELMSWKFSRTDGGIVTNCKSETAQIKPFFKKSWLYRRCLIPADGFYEWKQEGSRKQPYRIVIKSEESFWFAGLWQRSTPMGETTHRSKVLETIKSEFVILTRAANGDVAHLHNRMPLILKPDELEQWLQPTDSGTVPEGIMPGMLRAYPVASLVWTPGLETPECIVPFVPAVTQAELF